MTTDQDEQDGESADEELDLEKLFESIPSEEPELESELDYTSGEGEVNQPATEDPEPPATDDSLPDSVGEGDEDDSATGSRGRRSGRFDKYFDQVDTSNEGRGIDDLIAKMGGESPSSEPQPSGVEEPGPSSRDSLSIEALSGESAHENTEQTDREEATDSVTGEPADAALEGLSDVSDVLFKASRSGGADTDVCHPFFEMFPPAEQNVLLVSLRQNSEDRLDAFYTESRGTPGQLAVITSSDSARSTTTVKGDDSQSNITVKVVNDPGDLTRLGITISSVLSSWQGNGNQTLVCFDSLSSLLQYADLQRVFRFIHVLQGRLGNVDATTHYHLDPEAHDRQTEATMRSLFDGVISVSDTGELVFE